MRAAATAVWAALYLVLSAAFATAGDDELLHQGDWVRVGLAAGERKTISFAGVAGASLDLRAAGVRGGRAAPRVTLLDPQGANAAVADADGGRVARIDGFTLGTSGVWRIVLESPTGGTLTLSTHAEPPLRLDWTGSGATADDRTFEAGPGGDVSVVLLADGDASVELFAPSGERLERASAKRGRAAISQAKLPELGEYTIRVAGAVGAYTARATVRPAAPRRRRFRDVESPPAVEGFAPGTAPNQSLFTLDLDGSGFTNRQTVAVVRDGEVIATAVVRTSAAPGATALLDLDDVPPGTYSLEIRRPGRTATAVPGEFAVTNLSPRIVSVDAGDAPNTGPFSVEVTGSGFDDDAEVIVRPAAGGDPLPVTIVRRREHHTIDFSVTPPALLTGLCDVEVRDSDGRSAETTGVIDLLGYRAEPSPAATVTDGAPLGLADAVYDEARGRVLAAFRQGSESVRLVLFDAATRATLDTDGITAADLGGGVFDEIQTAWDGTSDTFALCLTTSASPTRAYVRIMSAADIHQTVAEADLAAATAEAVSRVHAARNRDDGGYLVVWDEFDAEYGSRVWARKVAADGTFAPGDRTLVLWDPLGEVGHPTAAYQRNGAFVVAWAGLSEDRAAWAIRLTMTDAAGAPLAGTTPRVAATSRKWSAAVRPALAVNPADGATLLTWWYGEGVIYRPAARGIAPDTGAPLVTALLDEPLEFDGGTPSRAVWNAERGEFVVATAGYDSRVGVLRVAADGTLRPSVRAEVHEGTTAALYGGAVPGTLGLLRVGDAVDDGYFDKKTTTLRALAGPLR
jgi:hypothetical protein